MGIYDNDLYGLGRYGPDIVAAPYPGAKTTLPVVDFAYLLPGTSSQVINYNQVQVSWGEIDSSSVSNVAEFRLLSSPWGFPVDENDGTVLLDVVLADAPVPTAYNDTTPVPGKMTYYGIYMLVTGGSWVRAGFSACLMPYDYGSGARLLSLMPEYYRSFGATANTVPQPPVPVIAPAIPASGQQVSNPYGFDVNVYISGTLTGLIVNGIPVSPASYFILLGGGSVTLNFPYPMWVSGASYVEGSSVISDNVSFTCIEAIADSVVLPGDDGVHWAEIASSPFPAWTPGLTWNSGQIVIYEGEYYEAVYQVVTSTVAPGIDTVYWKNIDPEPVEWEWTRVAVQQADTYLEDFLSIAGYGLDFLKTQYDFELSSLNSPMKMSLGDLEEFCDQVGMPFSTELPAYNMRKAALYWAQVMLERGTLGGIAEHVSLFSGYDVDLSLSRNILLDDDMSVPLDPVTPPWDAGSKYEVGDLVTYPVAQEWNLLSTYPIGAVVEYDGLLYEATEQAEGIPPTDTADWSQNILGPFTYTCHTAVTSLPGTPPSGSPTEVNTYWYPVYASWNGSSYVTEECTIEPLVGDAGIWEELSPNGPTGTIALGVGFPDPLTWNTQTPGATSEPPNLDSLTYRASNLTGSAYANYWVRDIARTESDIAGDLGNHAPDQQVVIEHATPVPQTALWDSVKTYALGEVAEYQGSYFVAQRGSQGASPPVLGQPLNTDPGFSNDPATEWGTTTGAVITRVTSPVLTGSHALNIAYSGSASYTQAVSVESYPVIPGATYSITGFARTSIASQVVSLTVSAFDPFGNYISSLNTSQVSLAENTWVPVSGNVTMPVSASEIVIGINSNGTGTWTGNVTWGYLSFMPVSTPEWAPMGLDNRLHVTTSAYTLADIGVNPTATTPVTPFSEFYDDWGNFIARGFSRQSSGYPDKYFFDSFGIGSLQPLPARLLDTGQAWTLAQGSMTVTPDQDARATTAESQGMTIVQVPASGYQAVTVTAEPTGDYDCGTVFWYADNSNFWFCGTTGLYYAVSGTVYRPFTFSDVFGVGDRMYVWTNNTTSVQTIPGTTTTVQGPSVVIWSNAPYSPSDVILVVSASPGAGQHAFPSPAPYTPATTTGITSYSGIIAEVAIP